MNNPIHISQSTHHPIDWALKGSIKEDLHGAEGEVASLYYQTTIASMAPANPKATQTVLKTESIETKKSILSRTKDWLWSIFGWGQPQPSSNVSDDQLNEDGANEDLLIGGPKLPEPAYNYQKRLSQTLTDRNRDLVNHLKDISEFEEEMRKSSSGNLDKFFFMSLVESSLKQKQLSQSKSLLAQEELLDLHKKNKELHKKHFALMDSINSESWIRGILRWINASLTGATIGGTAIAFASGGTAFAICLPIALIGKSVGMIFEGILKYQSDGKTGKLIILKQETKKNTTNERERLSDMQMMDGEIAALLKKIKQLLDNQTKAERESFGQR